MSGKHLFQIRRKDPRAGQRDPFYTPERDIAHIGPNLVAGAMHAMEEVFWEPWLRDFLEQRGITYDDIVESGAPIKLARALNMIIQEQNPVLAMDASGFSALPPDIQMLFYTRLGQVFLSAIWSGVKDVNRPGDEPPAAIQEILDYVDEVFGEFLAEDDSSSFESSFSD